MDNSSSHRIQHRLAVVDSEVPDFQGVKNGIYLSDMNTGKNGNVIFFKDNTLQCKSKNGTLLVLPKKFVVDENRGVIIGSSPVYSQSQGTVIIGDSSGEALVVGSDNIMIGRNVGDMMMEANNVIGIGCNTLKCSSAVGDSIAIGAGAMGECGKTEMNIGIGKEALSKINDSYNIGIGIEAGKEMVGPLINHNICIGRASLKNTQASAINLIAIGSHAGENLTGNNFQSVYIGDKVALNLASDIISVNNVGIGPDVLSEARNISDTICIGSGTGKDISGSKSILLGTNTGIGSLGVLNEEILIGNLSGSNRVYQESKNILIGSSAGQTGSGDLNVGIGNGVLGDSTTSGTVGIGSCAGQHSTGSNNVLIGQSAGIDSCGDSNVFLGERSGAGIAGSRNICIGRETQLGDSLNDSVMIGDNVFAKGNKAVVIGSSAGKASIGYLSKDILIGYQAGNGQKYGDKEILGSGARDRSESVAALTNGMILIGSGSGMGDSRNPENINSKDLLCIGHDAGRSDEQEFQSSIMIGNGAGSFATQVSDSVILGNSAGIGMAGSKNVYIGPSVGSNVKGDNNILIGSNIGDSLGQIDSRLIVGNKKRSVIYGDTEKGNLVLGVKSSGLNGWTDGEGTLAFIDGPRPTTVSGVSGVLYSANGHLEYMTPTKTCLLTYPYKFVRKGDLNGLAFEVKNVNGGSLVVVKIIPSVLVDYFLSVEILVNVVDGVIKGSIQGDSGAVGSSGKWKTKVEGNKVCLITDTQVDGLAYIEVIGEQVVGVN